MKPAASILSMFAKSPIRPLQKHMAVADKCTHLLKDFFAAIMAADWLLVEKTYQEIDDCESKADEMKTQLRLNLPKNLFLPFHRSDLLDLLTRQEQLANRAEDVAGIMFGRKMAIPEALHPTFREYLGTACEASHQAYAAISELDELLEAGFRGRIVDYVRQQIKVLDQLETDTDKYERQLRRELFSIEKKLPAIDVMFLYKVIDWIGDIADCAQRTGNRLLVLMAS